MVISNFLGMHHNNSFNCELSHKRESILLSFRRVFFSFCYTRSEQKFSFSKKLSLSKTLGKTGPFLCISI